MPLKVKLGKQDYIVNLNQYRNWHYHVMNGVKKRYQEIAAIPICKLPKFDEIRLEFKLFKGSKRKTDRSNVLSIHEKFFCDALTKCQIIEDDSDEYIHSTTYLPTELDRVNPRVEITLYEVLSPKVEESRQGGALHG